MKKQFSIFFVLALLLPAGTQAQLLDAVNDSSEGGTLLPEVNLVSGRNNAPQATQGMSYDTNMDIITFYDNPTYLESVQSSTNPVSGKINVNFKRTSGYSYFAGCIQFCVDYSSRNTTFACGTPAGHYTVGTNYSSTTNVTQCQGVVGGSSLYPSYGDFYSASNAYSGTHNYTFFRSGTVDVQYLLGTNYCITVNAINSNNKAIQFRVGTAPGNFSLDGYNTFSKTNYTAVAEFSTPNGRNNERCIKFSKDYVDSYLYFNVSGVNYVPTNTYTIDDTNNANTMRAYNGSVGSYCINTSTDYAWLFRIGTAKVINPNHSTSPMYVRVDGQNTYRSSMVVQYGSIPALHSLTVSTAGTGANGSASISCAENHGYPSGGFESGSSGNYYYDGTTVTLVAPSANSGYHFVNWTKSGSSKSTDASYALGDVSSTNSGAYVANFDANSYKVHFDGNGSTSGSMSDQTGFKYNTPKALTTNDFARAYTVTYNYHGATGGNSTENNTVTYTFNGWNTQANGSGSSYTNGQSISTPTPTPSHNGTLNLCAQWTCASPSVTLPTPTKTGFRFDGWYTEENGGTLVGAGNASYTPTASSTLHAHWTAVYDVTFAVDATDNYGTLTANSITNVPTGSSITVSGNKVTINGTTITANPSDPTTGYTYSFGSWSKSPDNATVTSAMTFTAHFTRTGNPYTVRFNKNDEAATGEMSNQNLTYGTAQALTANAFELAGHDFAGWATSPSGEVVYADGANVSTLATSGTVDLYAKWTTKTYAVTFAKNEAGWGTLSATEITSVPYGTGITISGNQVTINGTTVTATAADATAQYTYGFGSWSKSPDNATVTGAMTITANFTRTTNTYTVTWKNGESVIETDEDVAYGTTPTYDGSAPTKESTVSTVYTHNGWTPDVAAVTGDAVYTATFGESIRQYAVTISTPENGTLAVEDASHNTVSNGDNVDYNTVLTLTATPAEGYRFKRWLNDAAASVTVTGAVTLGVEFEEASTPEIELYDDSDAATYTSLLSAYSDREVNVTLKNRTLAANQWNTIALPFTLATTDGTPLDGRVYDMTNTTTDNLNGMVISFAYTDMLEAGKPYLVWVDDAITEPRFEGVTLTSFDAGQVDAPSGDVEFRANMQDGLLTRKSSIFIRSNRLYYARPSGEGGTRIRAFRAYFEITAQGQGKMDYVQPRMRIVVEDQNATAIEGVIANDPSAPQVRKYVENGILIIERGGVRYNATGAVINE